MNNFNCLIILFWMFNVGFSLRKRQYPHFPTNSQYGNMRGVSDMGQFGQLAQFGNGAQMSDFSGQFANGAQMNGLSGRFANGAQLNGLSGQMSGLSGQLSEGSQMGDLSGNVRHKVKMGEAHHECDDGVTNLDVDWDGHPRNYTCYHPTRRILPNNKLSSVLECENLPKTYYPQHFCMNHPIEYNASIPTHGDHRPIWPKFGEYKFVPPQRWLHNIEHGAVVMLYHPCVHYTQVEKLRSIVKGCLRKHIITPSTLLTEDRPLALVAWGCRLLLSTVDEAEVVDFIRVKGLQGPEGFLPKEGQYTEGLLELATPPPGSDIKDSNVCPNSV